MPKVSVIIPCYNAAGTILDTLESIQAQTLPDLEILCIDDGSKDLTIPVLQSAAAKDPRIKVHVNTGKGPSAARNLGAYWLAQGDIIAFCDADDLWAPGKVAELVTAFDDPATDAVFGQIAFFTQTPADSQTRSTVPNGPLTIPMLLGENPVCTMSNVSIRSAALKRFGGLDTDIVHNEDLEWLIRLVGRGARIRGVPGLHTYYRTSPTGLSANLDAMEQGRDAAKRTAARFGYRPNRAAEAIHQRYLARRALRLGLPAKIALKHAVWGCLLSPFGFFNSPRRGALTLAGALGAAVLPRRTSEALFSR